MGNAAAIAAAFGGGLPPGITGTNDRCTILATNLNPEVSHLFFGVSFNGPKHTKRDDNGKKCCASLFYFTRCLKYSTFTVVNPTLYSERSSLINGGDSV